MENVLRLQTLELEQLEVGVEEPMISSCSYVVCGASSVVTTLVNAD